MPRSLPYAAIPILKALAERLKAQGKLGKQIVVAIMRRLLVLAYGVPGSRLG
jgi:transposase